MPARMRIVGDELTLDDACKNCEDGTTDLQVIQCNASNVHGYHFINGYVNVLRKSPAFRRRRHLDPRGIMADHSGSTRKRSRSHC